MLPDRTGWSAECVHVPAPTALPESAHGIGKITWTWSDLAVIFGNPSRGWEEWLVRAAARSDNACTSLLVWEHTAFSLGAQNLGRPPPGRTWKFCSRKYTIGCAVKYYVVSFQALCGRPCSSKGKAQTSARKSEKTRSHILASMATRVKRGMSARALLTLLSRHTFCSVSYTHLTLPTKA